MRRMELTLSPPMPRVWRQFKVRSDAMHFGKWEVWSKANAAPATVTAPDGVDDAPSGSAEARYQPYLNAPSYYASDVSIALAQGLVATGFAQMQ
jgi:hypothetical protein